MADTVARIALCFAAALRRRRKRRRQRTEWVRTWVDRRYEQGAYQNLLRELAEEDETSFQNFLRMDVNHFHQLLALVGPSIQKEDTNMRDSIPPGERLAVTLRFLASGDSYISLSYLYRIGRTTLGEIIPETCKAIVTSLKEQYMKVPNTVDEWKAVATTFQDKWNFPHCIGAIDGKHVAIKAPPNSGSVYYNYKEFHSIILLAVVDAHYRFLWYQLGDNGRQNDAGVYASSGIAAALDKNMLNFPAPSKIRRNSEEVPYVLVGDDAFPLKPHLMKPYPQRGLTDSQTIFNYRLSRARQVSENAFGILINRFRVLADTMNLEPDVAMAVTECCMALHNFLRTERDLRYAQSPARSCQEWPAESLMFFQGNNSAEKARKVRDKLKEYFWGEGQVPFQWRQIEIV